MTIFDLFKHRRISQGKILVYNGGISDFYPLLFIKDRVDVGQNVQGLSYEVCSTNMATVFRARIICYSFWDM